MPRLRFDDTRLDELPVPAQGQIDYWDPALPGFGLRVSQGGTRAWVMMVRVAGRKRRITLGAYPRLSLGEARAKREALLPSPTAAAARKGGDRSEPGDALDSRHRVAEQSEASRRATTQFAKTSHVTRRRSLAKTITWRITGSLDTFVLGYIITGQLKLGAMIAGAEVVTKMLLYYLHERGWAHVRWGLKTE